MNRVKKSHYIPQFKLKRFSTDQKHIQMYDKESFKCFYSAIEDAMCEHGMYDNQPEVLTKYLGEQFIEKTVFGRWLEPKIKTPFSELCSRSVA